MWSPWALLPLVHAGTTGAGLWLVYFIAVHDERIAPLGSKYTWRNSSLYPPYISIAGNFPPASCIFSQVMNISAFLGLLVVLLRFLQLRPLLAAAWLNSSSLLAFCSGCFGMTLVGNFQLFAEEMIHNFGTLLTFGLGLLFCWLQSFITLQVSEHAEGRRAGGVRVLLSVCITLCLILYFSLIPQGLHMQAAQCQWALVMFFLIFLSTFAIEFRHHRFETVVTDNAGRPVSRYQADRTEP